MVGSDERGLKRVLNGRLRLPPTHEYIPVVAAAREEFHLVYHDPFTVFAASHAPVTFNITIRTGWTDGGSIIRTNAAMFMSDSWPPSLA